MTTVNHNSGNFFIRIIIFFAKWTIVFIKKFANELFDLCAVEIWRIFSLFVEKGSWVLQFFHMI